MSKARVLDFSITQSWLSGDNYLEHDCSSTIVRYPKKKIKKIEAVYFLGGGLLDWSRG